MSRSTGPILATGAITLVNSTVLTSDNQPDWNQAAKVIVATGLAAGGMSLLERATPDLAVALSWAMLVAMMLTRLEPHTPSPTERIFAWWDQARK